MALAVINGVYYKLSTREMISNTSDSHVMKLHFGGLLPIHRFGRDIKIVLNQACIRKLRRCWRIPEFLPVQKSGRQVVTVTLRN